jgi:hypothetical protein
VDVITNAPESGIWNLNSKKLLHYDRFDYHRRAVESESEAFFLRIDGSGDYRYEGVDLGVLITRGRLMTDDFELNDRAKSWIKGIQSQYTARSLHEAATPAPSVSLEAGAFKIL